jgi:hypothetical protein
MLHTPLRTRHTFNNTKYNSWNQKLYCHLFADVLYTLKSMGSKNLSLKARDEKHFRFKKSSKLNRATFYAFFNKISEKAV